MPKTPHRPPNDLARSIKRTLEVLEFFDERRLTATVGEISRELGYPQSSTSILLKSLMTLGYLAYDAAARTYRPTARVALLGRGVQPRLFDDGRLMAALHQLSAKTGELVFLAARSDLSVHYIRTVPATNALRMHLEPGAVRPLVGSPIGSLFLSALGDAEIAQMHARSKAIAGHGGAPPLAEVIAETQIVRRQGSVLSTKTRTPGGGLVAMLLPVQDAQPLAICLGGVGTILVANAKRYAQYMREAIARHLLPESKKST